MDRNKRQNLSIASNNPYCVLQKVKILLIYPYFLDERLSAEDICVVPIGVYYVAAVLKKNLYDVEILNWYDINTTPHKIWQVLED